MPAFQPWRTSWRDTAILGIGRRDFLKTAAACAAATAAIPTVPAAQQPKRGGVLKHMGPEPPSFDIHGNLSYQTPLISSFLHRTLFVRQWAEAKSVGLTLVPISLKAEVWDGRMYTRARQGALGEQAPVNGRGWWRPT